MAGLIRTFGFFVPTLAVLAVAHLAEAAAGSELVDAVVSSLLIFTLPFWVGDYLVRRRRGTEPVPAHRELASGLAAAAAVQAVIWAFWMSQPSDIRYSFPVWVTLAHPLLAFVCGVLGIPKAESRALGDSRGGGGLRQLLTRTTFVLLSLAALGVIVRLAGGDRWALTLPFHLALPPVVLAGLGLGAALTGGLAGRRIAALAGLVLAIAAGLVALRADWRSGACAAARQPGALRLATWNVGHRLTGGMVERLHALDADLWVIVEGDGAGAWSEIFGELEVCDAGRGLVLLASTPIRDCVLRQLEGRSWAAVATLAHEPPVRVIAVDIDGNPIRSRSPAVATLAELVASDAPDRTFVLGDFNTPRRASAVAPLRRTHRDAFDAAGRGWAPTWPAWPRLLDLDHVWLPRPREAICARAAAGSGSDHLPVVLDVRWP